jgi:hypothetical protein
LPPEDTDSPREMARTQFAACIDSKFLFLSPFLVAAALLSAVLTRSAGGGRVAGAAGGVAAAAAGASRPPCFRYGTCRGGTCGSFSPAAGATSASAASAASSISSTTGQRSARPLAKGEGRGGGAGGKRERGSEVAMQPLRAFVRRERMLEGMPAGRCGYTSTCRPQQQRIRLSLSLSLSLNHSLTHSLTLTLSQRKRIRDSRRDH